MNQTPQSSVSSQGEMMIQVNWHIVIAIVFWLGLSYFLEWIDLFGPAWKLAIAGFVVLALGSVRSVPKK